MPTVTGLREERRGRVAVELDGAPWRTLPADVVVRAGLSVGRALDRADLRLVRREVRRAEALSIATGALAGRDHSRRQLLQRLERRGVAPAARDEAVGALQRSGLIDDLRFARTRAEALASRGYGNAAIRADLERRGVGSDARQDALRSLDPETERARGLIQRRGTGARTARFLAARGFSPEVVETAGGADFAPDP